MDSIQYVYGIVPSTFAATTEPKGLDGAGITRVSEGNLTALVSHLSAQDYSPDKLEIRTGEVDWLGPRAVAHDRVVTWAGDAGPVIPFPMWTLFSGEPGVRAMLEERSNEFSKTLKSVEGTHEYAVRVFASPAAVFRLLFRRASRNS